MLITAHKIFFPNDLMQFIRETKYHHTQKNNTFHSRPQIILQVNPIFILIEQIFICKRRVKLIFLSVRVCTVQTDVPRSHAGGTENQ